VTKPRISVYLETGLLERVEQYAKVKKLSKSFVIEAAESAFFLPDATDQATFARRLDRLTRQYERLEHSLTILAEAFAQFVRFWIITTTPPPSDIDEAMQAKARDRYAVFIQAIIRRLVRGASVIREISDDLSAQRSRYAESRPDGP
jgi:predicted transcriptional regulator